MNDDRNNLSWLLASLLLVLSLLLGAKHRADIAQWFLAERPARAASLAADSAPAARPAPEAEPLRVLFIGNSLTATNDIPAMVARLAEGAQQPRAFAYQLDTPGGFGLSEHAVTGRLQQHLQHARWDTVVLQDQGQQPALWRSAREEKLNAPARVLHHAIRAAGARTLFYLTYARREGDVQNYPSDDYDAMQGRLAEGYAQIARELNAGLVPVGLIWQAVYREHPTLPLWAQDGQHPSVAGSYLAACAFYAYFYRDSPIDNPYVAGLDLADARTIQQGVAEVMLGWRRAGETSHSDPSSRTRDDVTGLQPSADPQPRPATNALATESAQDRARHAQIEADRAARALRVARARVPITLYSTRWCGYCRKASAYMQQAGIAFDEYDIDHDSTAKATVQRLNPRGSVPTIDLAGEVLIGWNPKHFEDSLDRAARTRARL